MEALATDADGAVSSIVLPLSATTAPPGRLLSGVTWSLGAVYSVLTDNVGSSSGLGYKRKSVTHEPRVNDPA